MTRTSLKTMNCSLAQTAEILGDRWSLLIVRDVFHGVNSFSKFLKNLGIARNVLSERLEKLVVNGVLERRQAKPGVERYTYHFTPAGEDFVPVLIAMVQWGDKWVVGEHKKPMELVDSQSWLPIMPIKLQSQTGESLNIDQIGFQPGPGAEPWMDGLFETLGNKSSG